MYLGRREQEALEETRPKKLANPPIIMENNLQNFVAYFYSIQKKKKGEISDCIAQTRSIEIIYKIIEFYYAAKLKESSYNVYASL